MSEEILKALMQLFAIVAKQDAGVDEREVEYVHTFLTQQLNEETVAEYMSLFHDKVEEQVTTKPTKRKTDANKPGKFERTRVGDMVRVLKICRKINKTLNQSQKVIALVRLFELVNANRMFSEQRMAIITTVADAFNISKEEFKSVEAFVIENEPTKIDNENILLINEEKPQNEFSKFIQSETLDGIIVILRIKNAELYFLKYTGNQDVFLNGLGVSNTRIYLFATGSTLKLPKGKPVYYSDVVSTYLSDRKSVSLSFEVNNVDFVFPNGGIGLRNINFSAQHGRLIGIMGASGAGKTTLLNLLSGISAPTKGEVLINGVNLHKQSDELEGVIGYIPQDDLLIEELTVFENLYYNAKLCFRNKSEDEIKNLVHDTLKNLGLFERKDLKVGTPLNKMISGGQRKRLNIALELIREPSILFVDEPTSGLSSRDSENVMDLLSELTLKGKLIFVVIHQPSSDIYKMFDRMMILDTGGYLIYYGNPVEGIVYFKQIDGQINSEVGECPTCGNVTPEIIFNIVEAKVVDEFGNYTPNRKVLPAKWEEHYKRNIETEEVEQVNDEPPKNLNIPTWFNQTKIFITRDILAKVSNAQYVILNLLEAPLLGFILSFLIRYIADPNSNIYIFRENENIPPYIFMSIVVALFLGMTVSAEEIFRDRKILKRESFLNLSRSSYLSSKMIILIFISAIQSFLYVIVGNSILEVDGMYFYYWFVLFAVFVFANMVGLNISASFNSAVTIYILIPLILIPLMSLGGAMFSFDKLNRAIGSVGKVPIVAELMASRWAYEGLMVHQFKENAFERDYYDIEQRRSMADFKNVYYLPEILELVNKSELHYDTEDDSLRTVIKNDLELIQYELGKEHNRNPQIMEDAPELLKQVTHENFNDTVAEDIKSYISMLDAHYGEIFYQADTEKERIINYLEEKAPGYYKRRRKSYHNEKLDDIVRNVYEKNKILRYKNTLVQQDAPIFLKPEPAHLFDFRTHFYAPKKYFAGHYFETFWFNVMVIWLMAFMLYVPLYYSHLKRFIQAVEKLDLGARIEKLDIRKKIKKRKEKNHSKKLENIEKEK